jgi:hypothetical protein
MNLEENKDEKILKEQNTNYILLWVKAFNLSNDFFFFEINPLIAIFFKDTETNMYYELGRTNSVIDNQFNPSNNLK